MSKREDGHYWVKRLGKWTVGCYSQAGWSIIGEIWGFYLDSDFEEIGDFIPPHWVGSESKPEAV